MNDKSNAGTIILVVIGALVIGVEGLTIMNQQNQISGLENASGIKNTWYTLFLETINVNSTGYEPIVPLNTTINVSSGEWVYVSFATNAKLDPVDNLRHSLNFLFTVDGVAKAPGFVYEEILANATEDDVEWIPVNFHAIFKDITPGDHSICIVVLVNYMPCIGFIGGVTGSMGSSLLIQTLIP
ncbi:MAG: hypothetical protein GY870_09885 [archaeon]|nr:hypothetical protein [archaeon]